MKRFLPAVALLGAVTSDLQVHAPPGIADRFQAPPGIQWNFFRNADGARIRYSHLPVAAGEVKATVVLMHGYSEFGEKYFELMRDLGSRGNEVWQMDWRGYGGSDRYLADREKAHSLGPDHDTRDLDQFVRTIVKAAPGRPLVLIAHSMGGHLAVRYLHDYPGRFTAAVLSAPFLSLAPGAGGMPEWLVRTVIWGADTFGFRESWAKGSGPWVDQPVENLSHDPVRGDVQRQWNRANPVLRIGGVTNGWVREYMRSFDLMARPGYHAAIKLPVLMGSASDDILTQPAVQARACSEMANCRLMRFDHAWHELFMESDAHRAPWLNAIFAFEDSLK